MCIMKNVFTSSDLTQAIEIQNAVLNLKGAILLENHGRRHAYVPLTEKELEVSELLSQCFESINSVLNLMIE